MSGDHDLERFLAAQEAGDVYSRAIAELRSGRKRSHWMWFVFPQIAGLGRSPMSQRFAIATLAEASAYLDHPVLGARLIECARAACDLDTASAEDIFGPVDAQKLRSSMTLFLRAAPTERAFAAVIERYFDGQPDLATDERLALVAELDRPPPAASDLEGPGIRVRG
ncbi:MAG TPA: DUF1810 domain-containing protein [Solirubrobacteraceae bacterium]|nr:DUF1810 domain-containing protein [Solirubrobacteraceae bacterium]HME05116.1 DUF1810 domain-containing protein [Solirubrobacteraceae bacterium]